MGSQGVCTCAWVQGRRGAPGTVHPCPQRPYDIHSNNAVESLVQLFSTVSVQYVPTWSKEMVALLRKVSLLPPLPPRALSLLHSLCQDVREVPHLSMVTDPFPSTAVTFPGQPL